MSAPMSPGSPRRSARMMPPSTSSVDTDLEIAEPALDFYDVPLPQPSPHAFGAYDVVLCQYDNYPLWPGLIFPSAADGSFRKYLRPDIQSETIPISPPDPLVSSPPSKSSKSTPINTNQNTPQLYSSSSSSSSVCKPLRHVHKQNKPVEAYHVMFPNDRSSAWVRADLIIKFHPDISSYVQVSSTECDYAEEQTIALDDAIKYFNEKLIGKVDQSVLPPNPFPTRKSPKSDAYKRSVARLLGQWMLLTQDISLIVTGCFSYFDVLSDGRKLPSVLRDNLASFKHWPRQKVVPVPADGAITALLPTGPIRPQLKKAINKKKRSATQTRRRILPRRRAKKSSRSRSICQ